MVEGQRGAEWEGLTHMPGQWVPGLLQPPQAGASVLTRGYVVGIGRVSPLDRFQFLRALQRSPWLTYLFIQWEAP